MKTSRFLFFIFFIFALGCSKKEVTPIDLAKNIIETYENHSSLSYNIDYSIKYFSSVDDTTKVSARIDLIRIPEDSIFGGHVWIKSDSIDRYYDTKNLYFISHQKKHITQFPQNQVSPIKGNTVGDAIRMYFLDPSRLMNGATDSTNLIELNEEQLNQKQVWKWRYIFADDEYSENTWKNIWIDKENYTIPKMTFSSDMQGENQFNQWDLSNISFDKVSVNDLENRFARIQENYSMEVYKERPKEESEPLANGTSIPNLSGKLYPDNKLVSLEDYKGKVLLLDFWYMDCFPCIKAIPHLNEMYNKYSDQGFEVVGINPFDNNEKDLKRLPNFLSKNTIDYAIMFVDREESKKFKVYAYPTFYLIDRKGKILHSGVGFSEKMTNSIDSLIQINL